MRRRTTTTGRFAKRDLYFEQFLTFLAIRGFPADVHALPSRTKTRRVNTRNVIGSLSAMENYARVMDERLKSEAIYFRPHIDARE